MSELALMTFAASLLFELPTIGLALTNKRKKGHRFCTCGPSIGYAWLGGWPANRLTQPHASAWTPCLVDCSDCAQGRALSTSQSRLRVLFTEARSGFEDTEKPQAPWRPWPWAEENDLADLVHQVLLLVARRWTDSARSAPRLRTRRLMRLGRFLLAPS